MKDDWRAEQLKRRSETVEAIAAAHVDAGNGDYGWIKVDRHGNLKRVDPAKVQVKELAK